MMTKGLSAAEPAANRLLARLPTAEQERLLPHLQPVDLEFKQVLYQAQGPIDFAYFPTRGVVSALTVMEDGSAIEMANIGNEGMAGLPVLLESEFSPYKVIVQVEGAALRITPAILLEETRKQDHPLRWLLARYQTAFLMQVSQSVACNGLHTIRQRCCRWLLMTRDRVGANEVPLTHEFLAIMLGVRRPSVTEVLQPLKEEGLLRYSRGKITILDREGGPPGGGPPPRAPPPPPLAIAETVSWPGPGRKIALRYALNGPASGG
jgi:CRP-like cAMP-binding protein